MYRNGMKENGKTGKDVSEEEDRISSRYTEKGNGERKRVVSLHYVPVHFLHYGFEQTKCHIPLQQVFVVLMLVA